MTDLVAGDLTYSFNIKDKVFLGRKGYQVRGTIAFGNGALTVPSGGIPLTKGKMGLPRFVRSLKVLESNQGGYAYEYDVSAEKLFVMRIAAPTISLANAGANAVGNAAVWSNTGVLSHGIAAATGVTGVQATTLAAFTGAPAAQTLQIEAEGY